MEETEASEKRKPTTHVQLPFTSTQVSTSVIPSLPSLPQEIISEILTKLPVKSLLRYRCVSESWLALICSPEFVKTHLDSSANDEEYKNHRVVLNWKVELKECSLRSLLYNPIPDTSEMVFPMRDIDIKWCASVNGLICFAGTEKNYESIRFRERGISLCVWNPSIRKGKMLPLVTSTSPRTYFRYGFGYDEVHDEYKIVVICNMFDDKMVRIYSLKKDNCWRTAPNFEEISFIDSSAKYVKGKLYWTSAIVCENNGFSRIIISFDLASETWGNVDQPDFGNGLFSFMLGVLGNDLVAFCNYERIETHVWIMNDNGGETSWKQMITISCPVMSFPPFFCQSYKGQVLLMCSSVFMIYNPKEDSIRKVKVDEPMGWLEAEIFVESLVNPLIRDTDDSNEVGKSCC